MFLLSFGFFISDEPRCLLTQDGMATRHGLQQKHVVLVVVPGLFQSVPNCIDLALRPIKSLWFCKARTAWAGQKSVVQSKQVILYMFEDFPFDLFQPMVIFFVFVPAL